MKRKTTVFIPSLMALRAAREQMPLETALGRIRRRGVLAALVAAATTFPVEAAAAPLPADVQRAIHDRLSRPDMRIEVEQPPESGFVHYSRTGMVERLDCDHHTSYRLYRPESSVAESSVTVGECKEKRRAERAIWGHSGGRRQGGFGYGDWQAIARHA